MLCEPGRCIEVSVLRSAYPATASHVVGGHRGLVDTSRLSDAELFRHYKRTAPVEDLRFFLRHARLSPDLRADGEALLAIGCRDTDGTRADSFRGESRVCLWNSCSRRIARAVSPQICRVHAVVV